MNGAASAIPPRFAPVEVERVARPDGGFVLRSPRPLGPLSRAVGDQLEAWASRHPERVLLAERGPDRAWIEVTYGAAFASVRALGQALLDLGLGPTRPLLLLSGNSIDHALLQLAGMHVGVPVAPVSPAYGLLSRDFAKLRSLAGVLRPGAIYAADGAAFAGAARALALDVPWFVSTRPEALGAADVRSVADAARTSVGPEVAAAFARLGPDTIGKVLFTSGSTGAPKGVVNTQRMLCANQRQIGDTWPLLDDEPPIVVDWLPWSHTFGGNHNFLMVLWHGGTLYLDAGKPVPGAFDETLRNLREISPTLYFNVPRGFDLLVTELERDDALAASFFRRLQLLFYAAAALSPAVGARLDAVSRRARGTAVPFVSAWGLTETTPLVTQVHWVGARTGNIGVPARGTEVAFVPLGSKLELRVRGPNVSPGYFHNDGDAIRIAPLPLDDEGFFATGDAGRLEDDADPARGIRFEGRLAENFKLATGTWVHVGELRLAVVAALAPLAADAVITGHDRGAIGVLVFPAPEAARDDGLSLALRDKLCAFNRTSGGSSRTVDRALVLDEPPQIDAGEITDKGYLNQRAVLERRAALVERLYAGGPEVIVLA